MTKVKKVTTAQVGAPVATPKQNATVELSAEESVIAAKLTIERGGRLMNKSLSHDLKIARFIGNEFKVPARLINKEELEKVCSKIEGGVGYTNVTGKRAALSVITKEKVKEQVASTLEDLNKFPLSEEQREAVAKAAIKYEAFLNKYVESEGIAILKKMFLGA